MPIGIISESDYNREVPALREDILRDHNENVTARIEVDKEKGRNGAKEIPESIRAVIAQESLLGTSAKQLSAEFNVSPSSISAYKNGATSTTSYNNPDKLLKNKNNIFRDRIVRKSSRLALSALDSIGDSDFKNASLTDKANVAKQMASIVRDMKVADEDNAGTPIAQIIIHAPPMRRDDDYINVIASVD